MHTFSKHFTLTVKHLNKYNHTYPAVPLFLAYNWTKHFNLTWENGNELYNFVLSYAIIGGVLYDCWWCFLLITHLCNTCVTADQCFIIKYLLFVWAEPLVLFGLLKSRKENRIHFFVWKLSFSVSPMYFCKSVNKSKKSEEANILNKLQLTATTFRHPSFSEIFDKCDSIHKMLWYYLPLILLLIECNNYILRLCDKFKMYHPDQNKLQLEPWYCVNHQWCYYTSWES